MSSLQHIVRNRQWNLRFSQNSSKGISTIEEAGITGTTDHTEEAEATTITEIVLIIEKVGSIVEEEADSTVTVEVAAVENITSTTDINETQKLEQHTWKTCRIYFGNKTVS